MEYRLYQDGENWVMEQYQNKELIHAVIGESKQDCLEQMFPEIFILDTIGGDE